VLCEEDQAGRDAADPNVTELLIRSELLVKEESVKMTD
jgi:hypothetical protein